MLRVGLLLAAALSLASCAMGHYPLTNGLASSGDPVHSISVTPTPRV